MTNLKLITTETFGDLSCNFYRNMNDDILLTREQIGIALEYSDPDVALSKIHKKHKDRLDELSVVKKIKCKDGKFYNSCLYTLEGALVICSLSTPAILEVKFCKQFCNASARGSIIIAQIRDTAHPPPSRKKSKIY